jgi:hypothetical protein
MMHLYRNAPDTNDSPRHTLHHFTGNFGQNVTSHHSELTYAVTQCVKRSLPRVHLPLQANFSHDSTFTVPPLPVTPILSACAINPCQFNIKERPIVAGQHATRPQRVLLWPIIMRERFAFHDDFIGLARIWREFALCDGRVVQKRQNHLVFPGDSRVRVLGGRL